MFRTWIIIIWICSVNILFAQSGLETEYGQNRIQYHDDFDDWYQYETQNFVTYWYGKARNVGQFTLSMAEHDFKSIENILEHKLNDKIEIICYTDISDLKQSNIGVDDVVLSKDGRTLVSGNKIFIYYDGDHSHLRKRIREGMAEVYLNAMIYGSGLTGLVQRSVRTKIPDWFNQGLIAYLGEEWNTVADNELRDLLQSYPKKTEFEQLAKVKPRLMGHAFWNYLTKQYGGSNVSNILYLTRINRSIKSSFLYILGIAFDDIATACVGEFRKNFNDERSAFKSINTQQALSAKNKRKLPITYTKLSPGGKELAYVVNRNGRYKVYTQSIQGNKKPKKVLTGGIRNNVQETDYSIPVLSWHPQKNELVLVTEKRDIWWLYQIDVDNKKKTKAKLATEYQRIYEVDYIDDKTLLLNASTDALSDLYAYLPVTRESRRLTADFYDDLNASYGTLLGQKGILFKSNRERDTVFTSPLDSILPIQPFNLYFLPLGDDLAVSKKVWRFTANKDYDIDRPSISGTNQITFLSDESGVKQAKTLKISADQNNTLIHSSHGDHDYLTYHAASGKGVGVIQKGKRIYLIKDNPDKVDTIALARTTYRKGQIRDHKIEAFEENISISKSANQSDTSAPTSTSLFQSQFPDFESPAEAIEIKKKNTSPVAGENNATTSTNNALPNVFNPGRTEIPEKFQFTRMIASRLKFKLQNMVTTMDNSLLFGGLNSYAGQKPGFEYPPAGFLIKAQIEDLFEDYGLEGGVRIPSNFNGTEYFLTFENNKRRIDKKFGIYRQTRYATEELTAILAQRRRNRTMIATAQLKYPFDSYQSVRLLSTIRFDRSVLLATNINNIDIDPTTTQRIGLKAEYVYDNATPIDINRFVGTRAKVYVEALKKMQIEVIDNWNIDFAKGFMTVLGYDARQYIGLDKRTILALRSAGATSFGSEKILFFLGGVDNWLAPQYDEDTPTPSDGNYAFYALGAHLRGFKQNIRNGSSYLLFNTELRVPVFQYFSNREIRSNFLRTFQVVGFFDAGTAWFGRNPFDQRSPLNTTSVSNTKVSIDLIYARDPLVLGYGAGLHMSLMGYLIRADYAWGIETREVLKPRFYLSLGADF